MERKEFQELLKSLSLEFQLLMQHDAKEKQLVYPICTEML